MRIEISLKLVICNTLNERICICININLSTLS